MNDHTDQLREAFEAHEHLAPDAASVYARVQELSRTHQRRRRGLQAAGGAVLGVGLVAGGMNLPSLLPGGTPTTVTVVGPAAAPTTPAAVPTTPAQEEIDRNLTAYFAAGYGWPDARRLARLWHQGNDIVGVKAEAGRRLLAGDTLPIEPAAGAPDPVDAAETAKVKAFFGAGYDYDDAVTLAKLWKTAEVYDAKVKAGKKLLAGETLPIRP